MARFKISDFTGEPHDFAINRLLADAKLLEFLAHHNLQTLLGARGGSRAFLAGHRNLTEFAVRFRNGQRAGFARLQRGLLLGLNRNRLDEHLAHSGEPIAVDPASCNQPAEKASNREEMGNANHNDELENGVHGVTSCCKANSCPR